VTHLNAGTYTLVIHDHSSFHNFDLSGPGVSADRSASDGFRLAGPGVTRSTGVTFKGSADWAVTLKAGKYSFGSLRTPTLRRSLTISG
jgi:hypothetical protein